MRNWMMIGAAAFVLAGCEVKQSEPAAERAEATERAEAAPISQADAEKIVGEVHATFTGGDAFKVMEHYAPGAVIFDPSHVEPTSDRAIQTKWTADFVAMKPSDLVALPRQVQLLDGDTFVASGIASFVADVGGVRQRLRARYSQVFERQDDGSWRIVHEHMSLPPGPAGPGA